MSGKLTLDTEAGGSVTITVDDTETSDIEYPLDSAGIVNGSNDDCYWTQFPDGTLIVNQVLHNGTAPIATGLSFSRPTGALFQTPNILLTYAQPIPFVGGQDDITVHLEYESTLGDDTSVLGIRITGAYDNRVGFIVNSAVDYITTDGMIKMTMIGRWK